MTWPFLFSLRSGRIVRNGPPEATQPEPKQRNAPAKKKAPKGEEAPF